MPSSKIKPARTGRNLKTYELNDKQELFVQEYCVDLNQAAAARRAGFTSRTAPNKLMNHQGVVNAIRLQLGKRAQETEIDAKKVLYELALLAFSDPAHMFDEDGSILHIKDMPEGIRKSIASCEVVSREHTDGSTTSFAKIKFWSKLEALSLIGKHLGILGSTVENKHLHLHSATTNPYLNAPDELILQAKTAMTKLEHSVKGRVIDVEVE